MGLLKNSRLHASHAHSVDTLNGHGLAIAFWAVQGLAGMGLHPSYAHLGSGYPVGEPSLMRRLGRVLSALAHWAPVLGESAFLPALAFPFVRLFRADLESCFEVPQLQHTAPTASGIYSLYVVPVCAGHLHLHKQGFVEDQWPAGPGCAVKGCNLL